MVSQTFTVHTTIPDNNMIGLADTRSVLSGITEISQVTLVLAFSGGWNGDLFAYLAHDSGFCVLLNRPGRTRALPSGSPSSGLEVLFTATATEDIHTAIPASGFVTGNYQPDGRTTVQAGAFDTDPRTATFESFIGGRADGDWTLFVADASLGSTAVLESWTLTVTGVPEPASWLLSLISVPMLLVRRRP